MQDLIIAHAAPLSVRAYTTPGVETLPLMVRIAAMDAGHVTEIRRTLDPQPDWDDGVLYWLGTLFDWEAFNAGNSSTIRCPLGGAGGQLRVLEEWWTDDENGCHYRATDIPASWWERVDDQCLPSPSIRRAPPPKWYPADTLPPWASRYVLEVLTVGAELYDGEWRWVLETKEI
jgi:hypothetical protein